MQTYPVLPLTLCPPFILKAATVITLVSGLIVLSPPLRLPRHALPRWPIKVLSPSQYLSAPATFHPAYSATAKQADTTVAVNATWTPRTDTELVMAYTQEDDISWVSNFLPDISSSLYSVDDPSATLRVPLNRGHEAMAYLTYIIDHYLELPDVIIFMHAHRLAWHNSGSLDFDSVNIVRRLNLDRVKRLGYMNLRCEQDPGCPEWLHPYENETLLEKQEQPVIGEVWHELFPGYEMPVALGQACCAQFAVSREMVLGTSLDRWVGYRDWLMRTPLADYFSGRVFEFTWQYIFTGHAIVCPGEEECFCDGYGLCNGAGPF